MNQMDGKRLSKDMDGRVNCWGGCNINQMFDKVKPIMDENNHDVFLLHIGTNDSTKKTSVEMINEMIILNENIQQSYGSRVIVSNIIGRIDNGDAHLTGKHFNEKLSKLEVAVMDTCNVTSKYLGKQGLHLTSTYGAGRLAKTLIKLFKSL